MHQEERNRFYLAISQIQIAARTGGLLVGDEVAITLELELLRA